MNFWLFAGFLALVFLMGGGSRADVQSQIFVRMAAVLAMAAWALQIGADQLRYARVPILFLIAAVALIAIQLVPLPPSIWTSLPGREIFVEGFALAEMEPGWQPLSLTPDRTLNSLLALLPAVAAALGLAIIGPERYRALILLLLAAIFLSALVAIVQLSSGALYLYRITNEGSAVGLFANRNHQALLLAAGFPLLACVTAQYHTNPNHRNLQSWLAGLVCVLFVPMLLVTGSRAGLVLGVVGGLFAFAIGRSRPGNTPRPSTRQRWHLLIPAAMMIMATVATIFLSRDLALQRVYGEFGAQETRTQNLGLYVRMAQDFMPFGTGFGAFDPIYRIYEPFDALDMTYLNHAHNDLVQLAIEGGVAGVFLAAAFIFWFMRRSWQLWAREGAGGAYGRTGSAIVILVLMASLVDYPLRTPIHSVVMIIAVFLMLPGGVGRPVRAAKPSLEYSNSSSNRPRRQSK